MEEFENQKNHLLLNDVMLSLQKKSFNIVVLVIGGTRGNISKSIMNKISESGNDRLLFLREKLIILQTICFIDYFILSLKM